LILISDYLGEPALIAASYVYEQGRQARIDPGLEATMALIQAIEE
jgi:hypothetical protein